MSGAVEFDPEQPPEYVVLHEGGPTWATSTHEITLSFKFHPKGSLKNNPHWNEAFSGNSFWPELCCAFTQVWFMAGRIYSRLGLPYPRVFTLAIFGLFVLSNATAVESGEQEGITGLWVTSTLAYLGLLGIIAWLRSRVRAHVRASGLLDLQQPQQHYLNGYCSDLFCVIPWLCGIPIVGYAKELASMDRQLMPSVVPPLDAPRLAGPRPSWSSTLWGCSWALTGDCPILCCAWQFPCFMQTRIMYRLGVGSVPKTVGLFVLETLAPLVFIIALVASRVQGAALGVALFILLTNLPGILVSVWIRTAVRKRYSIPGTVLDDAILATCCSACSLAQLDRETDVAREIVDAEAAESAARGPLSDMQGSFAKTEDSNGFVQPVYTEFSSSTSYGSSKAATVGQGKSDVNSLTL